VLFFSDLVRVFSISFSFKKIQKKPTPTRKRKSTHFSVERNVAPKNRTSKNGIIIIEEEEEAENGGGKRRRRRRPRRPNDDLSIAISGGQSRRDE
jgi:hypothetical protein